HRLRALIFAACGMAVALPGAAGGEAGTAHATPTQPQNDSRPGPAGNPAPVGVEDQIGDRLTRLGERLDAYRGAHGHFPAGTVPHPQFPPADRFSWLAELADDEGQPGRSRPLWDQRWHDPLNDRFVRQPMPDVLNPAVGEQVGRNRFPATHFAGMAGVGPDAPELPVTHPRAGIFGYDRQTRLEDIHDGTANTILVAGVQVRLGGWAGGGPGSVRSFTREPYVNGPDGFGTGQPDSMQVLMADGSVRTISKAVSPVIVRRMAAMADGFPLDDAVPGEPGDPPPVPRPTVEPVDDPDLAHAAPAPPRAARRADAPIDDPAPEEHADPPVAAPTPPEPAIDVAAALAQQIARYELPRPVAVRRLLVELEDMIGAPLDLGGGDTIELEARLDRTVSVRLEKTTVGAILDDVTRQAGISYTIDGGTIRLRPATAEPGLEGAAPAER
ncbi:MAG TPA: hypothetical protein VML55_07180, partial [Planctomycetaceae bacterium]|nr:hypothetical protein [Planctomycetaceae bacterium]